MPSSKSSQLARGRMEITRLIFDVSKYQMCDYHSLNPMDYYEAMLKLLAERG